MLDHIILTISNIDRSLSFYEAALKPLKIRFFIPYKGEGGHPDLWGFGDGKRAIFWLKQGKPDPASIHWGFGRKQSESRRLLRSGDSRWRPRQYLTPRASRILSGILRRRCL